MKSTQSSARRRKRNLQSNDELRRDRDIGAVVVRATSLGGVMEKINFTVNIQVAGGPAIAIAGLLEVDAYEKMEVIVPAKAAAAGTAQVTVSPAQLADTKMLVIQATSKDGSLKFKTSAAGAVDKPIFGPVTLLSDTACGLLGTQPDKLTFTNEAVAPATVTIFVARKAVT